MRLILIAVFLMACIHETSARRIRVAHSRGFAQSAAKWQVLDIVFTYRHNGRTNPFDVIFSANFTGPTGRKVRVPGFFDGGNNWVIRFSGNEIGEWSFETFSTVGALSGHRGKVSVDSSQHSSHHGALMINAENPSKLVYEDGTPSFTLAFELDWLFALDYGNISGLPKTDQILKAVKNNGFTQVVANIYAHDVGWKIADNVPSEYFYGKLPYGIFGGSNDNPDFSTLNLTLFNHWDRLLDKMQEMGLDAHLMIYVWNKKVRWPEIYSDADNRYFDYVIARYQAFSNVVWDVSKEALDYGRCDIPYLNERISRIRSLDAFKRLITVHDYEYNSVEHARVDFVSIQSWRSDLYSLMLQAGTTHADKPVVNIEHGGYESGPYFSFLGNYTKPETCLLRAYECVFAGVYASYYWQDAAWNIVIHDALEKADEERKPRFDFYGHLASLFNRYNFNELHPSSPKLTTNNRIGGNNLATNGYALTNGANRHLMLIREESERVDVVLPRPANGRISYAWYNPFSGEETERREVQWTGWNEFVKPWDHFAILILETK